MNSSNNSLGTDRNIDKIPFHPYFSFRDIIEFIILLIFLSVLTLLNPYYLENSDNFTPANPFVTPIHIQPK